jgi:hypothetical protein
MSSSVNGSFGVALSPRGLRGPDDLRAARGGLAAGFGLEAFAVLCTVRLVLDGFSNFVAPSLGVDSSLATAGATSAAVSSLTFFELFAIYFSFSSASLYPQSKTVQAEIGMNETLTN